MQCVPNADMLILCNSGNEAIHKAMTLARAFTGKEKVAKFEGGFHGSNEYSMWSCKRLEPDLIGPAERPRAVPEAAGMTRAHKENIVILPYAEPNAFNIIEEQAADLALVMIEPVMGPGMILVDKGFLRELRAVTEEAGVLLLYDEVITGFRLALGGGQEYLGVPSDLATFGKALGGGMPIGAIGCKKEMVEKTLALDPPLSVAGTFSGNAMTLAAGNALLDYLIANPQIYDEMEAKGAYLRQSFNEFATSKGYPATMNGAGSMWKVILAEPPISKPRDVIRQDKQALTEYALRLRLEGIFVPAPLHLAFISPAHSDADIEAILRGLRTALEGTFSS
jgi:glutamate-1-semialdehyde 2,1-aminomutase